MKFEEVHDKATAYLDEIAAEENGDDMPDAIEQALEKHSWMLSAFLGEKK